MARYIEDTVCDEALPVNTIAMLNRLQEILDKAHTNSALSLVGNDLLCFRKCLWLINSQVYKQLGYIDMSKEWAEFCTKQTP